MTSSNLRFVASLEFGVYRSPLYFYEKLVNYLIEKKLLWSYIHSKSNTCLEQGIPQCVAQMVGASIYNQKHNAPVTPIFGCVTFGEVWKFMQLDNHILYIDSENYYLNDVPKILGVLQMIIDFYKK